MKQRLLIGAGCAFALLSGCAHYTAKDGLTAIAQEPTAITKTRYKEIHPEPVSEPPDKALIASQEETIKSQQETIAQRNATIAQLQDQITSLSNENSMLAATAADQKAKLAMNESMISDLSGQVVGLQSKVNIENEKQQKAKEAAEAKAKALVTLEPLEQITYPKGYRTGDVLTTEKKQPVTIVFLPLGETTYSEGQIDEIMTSVSDLKAQITLVSGNKENSYMAVRSSGESAVLTEQGAIISNYALEGDPKSESATLRLDENRTFTLAVADLPQLDLFTSIKDGGDWKSLVKERSDSRDKTLRSILSEVDGSSCLVAASLYEPATSDWQRLTAYSWRDSSFSWPLMDTALALGWNDTYRQTHYSVESDAGNTLSLDGITERTDYLLNKRVVPLSSNVVNIGPASLEENGYARYGLVATYLVP
ncbi:MAG: hypothetical protein SPF89_00865 [Sphaerochaetaceae bacterium]|nr:hypothetical protein [Spirochaetales bacterium]MDY5498635.1 hypothetical protein [Sphaerochaetaceae bacterium]